MDTIHSTTHEINIALKSPPSFQKPYTAEPIPAPRYVEKSAMPLTEETIFLSAKCNGNIESVDVLIIEINAYIRLKQTAATRGSLGFKQRTIDNKQQKAKQISWKKEAGTEDILPLW